jgi:hypothetical protein
MAEKKQTVLEQILIMNVLDTSKLKRGDVLNHKGGRYSVCIVDVITDSLGRRWFGYFIVENCDSTYEEFKNALIDQDDGPDGLSILKCSFYESTHVHFLSEARFAPKFTFSEVEKTPLTAVEINQGKIEEIILDPDPMIPEEIKMDPDTAHLQDMLPIIRRD